MARRCAGSHQAAADLAEIGFGLQRNFLEEEHTARYFRQESWRPTFFSRNGWTPEEDQRIKDRAIRKVQELVAAYQKPTDREERLAKARTVVERARRKLVAP